MVFPLALDLEVVLAFALFDEADALEEGAGAGVGGHDVGAEAVESEACGFGWGEAVPHCQAECLGHKALALEWLAEPVAEAAVLEDASFDVGEGDAACDCVGGAFDDEPSLFAVGVVGFEFAVEGLGAVEVEAAGWDGVPGLEVGAGGLAEGDECVRIGGAGVAEGDAVGLGDDFGIRIAGSAGHGGVCRGRCGVGYQSITQMEWTL